MPDIRIDARTLKLLAPHIEKALKPLGEKLGLSLSYGGGRSDYDGSNGELKIRVEKVTAAGEVRTREAIAFERHCSLFGLKKEDLGKPIVYNGRVFTLIGLNPGAPKYPLIAKTVDGKTWRLPQRAAAA